MGLLQNIDYRLNGYHKKQTFDAKGDLVTLQYYLNYNSGTGEYSDLMVQENRVYERNVTTTILEKRTITIQWFGSGEEIATKVIEKYYSATEGYDANKRARGNLINTASMYLLSQVGLTDGKAFLVTVSADISTYIDGNTQPLLDTISASTEPYMTQAIKDQLNTILNVSYSS